MLSRREPPRREAGVELLREAAREYPELDTAAPVRPSLQRLIDQQVE